MSDRSETTVEEAEMLEIDPLALSNGDQPRTTDRQFSVPMADGIIAMIDIFGGDEIDIATSKGVVRFEFSRLFGPMPVTKTGAQRDLSYQHPFWRSVSLWTLQGCKTENGEAIWREPKKAVLQHIGGRHYRVIADGEPGHDW